MLTQIFQLFAKYHLNPKLSELCKPVSFFSLLASIAFLQSGNLAVSQVSPQDYHYPIQFDQYKQAFSLTNPAYISNNGSLGIDLANQFSGNTQGEVATFFSTISYQIADENQGNPQHIGLNIYNDQNGPKISRTRFYGMYSVNVALNDSITVSGGLAIGGISYSIDATTGSVATAGNTAYAPDAKGGVWLKGNHFYLGISLNQALNNQITPFRDPIQIERHFNFAAQQQIPISQNLKLNVSGNLRTGPNREEEGFLGFILRVQNTIDAGFSYQVNRAQIIPKIGIFDANLGNQKFNAMVSLRIPAPWSLGFRDLRALGLSASYQFP